MKYTMTVYTNKMGMEGFLGKIDSSIFHSFATYDEYRRSQLNKNKDTPIKAIAQNRKYPILPLVMLLTGFVSITALDQPLVFDLWHLPFQLIGGLCGIAFMLMWRRMDTSDKRSYLALGLPLLILGLAPINTSLTVSHLLILGSLFIAVLILPPLILRDRSVITFKFFPERVDKLDVFYTLISIPLAWAVFKLYFGVLSPEVPFNWPQPAEPEGAELVKLFLGINGVGIWDELFFINICFAILRSKFPMRIANPAQAVIYTTVLCDMAFTGWGPVFVGFLAITQGFMYERSRVLIWVLLVHLIVDYFLFQNIVSAYYPTLDVWWHP
jgi:hypothetical protein